MNVFLTLIIFVAHFAIIAQTPKIMHKRLGGTNDNFISTLQNLKAPIRQSNFGLPPTIQVKRAVIDSIIAINDSSVMVVTSHSLIEEFATGQYSYYDSISGFFVRHDSMVHKSLTYDSTGLWTPGRDLLINHAVFNAKLSCSTILSVLRNEFGLYYSTKNVVFVGFDCSSQSQQKSKKNSFWLVFYEPRNPNSLIIYAVFLCLSYFLILKWRLKFVRPA